MSVWICIGQRIRRKEADSEPVFKLPSIHDVQAAMAAAPPVEEPVSLKTAGVSFSSDLPSLESVLPVSAFQSSVSEEREWTASF